MLFYSRKLTDCGEADLIAAVQSGTMSVHAALKELERRRNPIPEETRLWKQLKSDWARLMRTVDKMSDSDRAQAFTSLSRSLLRRSLMSQKQR
jgi:hypothetical protein